MHGSEHPYILGEEPDAVYDPPWIIGRGPNHLQGLRVRPERVEPEPSLSFFTCGVSMQVPCYDDWTIG